MTLAALGNPACLYDEEYTHYEDLEGKDYPVNPFEYIPDASAEDLE